MPSACAQPSAKCRQHNSKLDSSSPQLISKRLAGPALRILSTIRSVQLENQHSGENSFVVFLVINPPSPELRFAVTIAFQVEVFGC